MKNQPNLPFRLLSSGSHDRKQKKRLTSLLGSSLLLLGVFAFAIASLLIHSLHTYSSGQILKVISLETYKEFLWDSYQWFIILETFKLGGVVTLICLILGYPVAYSLTKIKQPKILLTCYVLIFSPMLVSVVVRAYGWLLLLSGKGVVNFLLTKTGLIDKSLQLMFNFMGVTISMVHVLLAFMVFSIASVLRQLDLQLKEAAKDLGANRFKTFIKVILPLSMPGVVSGCQIVFVLSISAFVTPALLGGGRVNVLGYAIYQNTIDLNWPMAAVQATVLLVLVLSVLFMFNSLIRFLNR